MGDAMPGNLIIANDDSLVVGWSARPSAIPVNEFFELDVWLFDSESTMRLMQADALQVDASMPQHRHGMNHRPTVISLEGGRYLVQDMLFHMPGEWRMYFDVEVGGTIHRAEGTVRID